MNIFRNIIENVMFAVFEQQYATIIMIQNLFQP